MTLEKREKTGELLSAAELFTMVRDIPFVLGADGKPETLLEDNFGGCTRKHLFLAPRLRKVGYKVDIGIARFDWRELPIPDDILSLLKQPIQYHMFLYLNKDGNSFIADATWDGGMCILGFPLISWGKAGEIKLAVKPIDLSKQNLFVLQTRSLVSETMRKVQELFKGPQETPFNDAFNSWLGR